MFAVLMIVLTFVLIIGFAVQPLFEVKGKNRTGHGVTVEALALRKLSLYEQIKELELEYEMGNVSYDDFQRNRNELKREVSNVLEQMKSINFG
ncbi:MAG TPA: hypothetical protein EYG62_06540 [Candidatus Marinimicrobia bacterium]|nr:hypothetical protein [Candidatus Neomarinimicrobiota bacterium]